MTGDELSGFPCPWLDEISGYPCPRHPGDESCVEGCTNADCSLLPVYRTHIKLRADHDALRHAVLSKMTPEVTQSFYRQMAGVCSVFGGDWWDAKGRHFDALADVVAKL